MKKLLWLPLFAVLFLLNSCEKDLVEPENLSEDVTLETRSGPSVPFKGTYKTFPILLEADENGTLTFEIPSEGKATHLGKSTWFSTSKVFDTEIEPFPWVQTGTSTFTAADGSQLKGYFEGTTGPTDDSPFAGNGTYYITEGTGRFEGASGEGTYSYFVRSEDFVGFLTFQGILNTP